MNWVDAILIELIEHDHIREAIVVARTLCIPDTDVVRCLANSAEGLSDQDLVELGEMARGLVQEDSDDYISGGRFTGSGGGGNGMGAGICGGNGHEPAGDLRQPRGEGARPGCS